MRREHEGEGMMEETEKGIFITIWRREEKANELKG